jgi:hypothetical protein
MLARDELTDPERKLWDATQSGASVDLRTGDSERDDPTSGAAWDTSRQIRAQLLSELLTKTSGPADPRPRPLRLAGARVTGTLDLEAATLTRPVLLGGCFFDESITLTEASTYALRFPGCHVPGLTARRLRTQGNLDLNDAKVRGEIDLLGAHIGGQLNLDGATLTNPNGIALNADNLTVDQLMLCRDGFRAEGQVILRGAHIGQLEFDGATLTNPTGTALNAGDLTVDQLMLCRDGFRAEGQVILRGAHIGGQLAFDGATLTNPNGIALDLQEAHGGALLFRLETPPGGEVDFTHAQVGVYLDDETTWPTTLILRGFVYDSLYEDTKISVAARLRWLDRDSAGYAPQPYEQLAAVYRRAGRDDDARKVAIAKQRRRRDTLNWPGKLWSGLLRWTVGYGYRTWQAGLWLLGLLAVGATVFAWAYPGEMALAKKPGDPLPAFQPWIYSLDVLLPVVNLHQEEFWIPQGVARWWAWFSILAGWLLTTVVVAAISGLLRKD